MCLNDVVLLTENVWSGFLYIFPYILPILIALGSVWYAQRISENKTHEQLLKNLLDEVKYNLDLCDILSGEINNDLKMSIGNKESLFGLPLFYDAVWNRIRVKGQLNRIEHTLYKKLVMLYEQIDITNRLLLSYEQRKIKSKSDADLYFDEQNIRIKGVKRNIFENIIPLLHDVKELLEISSEK
ncbi:MAG: hypothetical protein ACXQS5_05780 [Candidatus Methanospirareceae archaeon]